MSMSTVGSALASTAVQAVNASNAAKQQAAEAKYEQAAAREEAKAAENSASMQRRQGYDAMNQQRLQTGRELGAVRATQGAGGLAADAGSNRDMTADLAERGASQAASAYQNALDSGYGSQLAAWKARARAAKAGSSARGAADAANTFNSTLLSGVRALGNAWNSSDLNLGGPTR